MATFEVRPGRFVREVEARGTLKAVKATPVIVPAGVGPLAEGGVPGEGRRAP